MIPEIGHFALWLAVSAALVLGSLPLLGAHRGRGDWMALARPTALLLFGLVLASFVCLAACFVRNDFSVLNVATHSNSALPLLFRMAATWGSHEGSMLLWLLMLTGWTMAVAVFSRQLPDPVRARILAVMGLLSLGFLLFVLLTSNPFLRLFPVPIDGSDLNPQLQDVGMIVHPPVLYMGYVGFSVSFAFAAAALIGGTLDGPWARWSRPWTTLSWMFLTLGIALGSGWAYYELGWGGWWFWDPVENASFMPWLAGTALIHSLAVTDKRGSIRSWTVLLAIVTFSLSLLGTFLVRSGVLTSVHSFASDPTRGLFILGLLALVIGSALGLYAWRAPRIGLGTRFSAVSRETFLLANNVLLLAALAVVMLGTLYPLLLDALGLGKISVGPPYFDTVFVPLVAPLVFLMGVGPLARWKQAELPDIGRRLRWAAGVTLVSALLAAAIGGDLAPMSVLGLAMAFWIVASLAVDLSERVHPRGTSWADAPGRLRQMPRATVGMMLAHLGVAVFICGVTVARSYQIERDVALRAGESAELRAYTFVFKGVREIQGPNYKALRAQVEVSRAGRMVAEMYPEKRFYTVQRRMMTEAAIDAGFTGDLYVSLGEAGAAGAWNLRISIKPLIDWVWGGCALMAAGGLLAATDRRYRVRSPRAVTTPADGFVIARRQA